MDISRLSTVAHAYNPKYSRGKDETITVPGQPRQKVLKTLSENNWAQ
jgi:hypothetical protein